MEKLKLIVHELTFGSRKSKVALIKELSKDEYETIDSVFNLAEKTDEQLNITLSYLFDYYADKLQKPLTNSR